MPLYPVTRGHFFALTSMTALGRLGDLPKVTQISRGRIATLSYNSHFRLNPVLLQLCLAGSLFYPECLAGYYHCVVATPTHTCGVQLVLVPGEEWSSFRSCEGYWRAPGRSSCPSQAPVHFTDEVVRLGQSWDWSEDLFLPMEWGSDTQGP